MTGAVVGVVLVLAIVVGLVAIVRAGARMQREAEARIAKARRAEATVRSVSSAPMQDQVRLRTSVKVVLDVADDAAGVREAFGFWTLDTARLAELAAGRVVPVRIDADDPTLAYPALPGVEHDIGNMRIWQNERARASE